MDVGRSASDPAEHVVRRGRVSWLTYPPEGRAHIGVESRAFTATPVSVPEGDAVPWEAAPGELLAITHAMLMAWALSEALVEAGSQPEELVVAAECTFAGPVAERELVTVALRVHGRGAGLDARTFDEAVGIARQRYRRSSGISEDLAGEVTAVLRPPHTRGGPQQP